MIFACNKCKTRYNIKPKYLKKSLLKVKCARCQHVFLIETNKKDPVELSQNDIASHAKIITICNQKGGVAKTSTCINLGAALSAQNKQVLLIDFDVLANLTLSFGYKKDKSFYQLIKNNKNININSIINKYSENIHLLPSNNDMNLFYKYSMGKKGFEFLLKNKLKEISADYDYILIDTPPSMGFLTLNALVASNYVLIPTQCEYFSMNGVEEVEKIIRTLEKKYQYSLPYNVLINLFDKKNTVSRVIYNQLNKKFSGNLLTTVIEKDHKIQEAQIMKKPVVSYANNDCKAVKQYLDLATEVTVLYEK